MDKYTQEYKAFAEHAESWNYDMEKNKDGYFVSSLTQRVFNAFCMGWKASRAALVVNTSELRSADYYVTGTVYLGDVEDALDKAGIKYE